MSAFNDGRQWTLAVGTLSELTSRKTLLLVLIALVAMLAPGRALAQWSSRPSLITLPPVTEQWGVKAGAFRIWPRLGVEGRYDSNFYRQEASQDPVGVGSLQIVPGLTLVNPKPRAFRLYLDVMGDVQVRFGGDKASEHTDGGVKAVLDLDVFPRSAIGFRVFDRFFRDIEARSYVSDDNYNRNENLGGVQVLFRPGGRALQFGVEYAFGIRLHDQFSAGDKLYHDLGLDVIWQFYPLTSAFLDVDFKVINYQERSADSDGYIPNVGSMPLRAQIGLNGYITRRLTLLVEAGWGQGFYESGSSFGGPIGTARLGYHITPSTLVQVGYARDYEDSLWANYWAEHRVFLSLQQQFLDRRIELQLNGTYRFREYSPRDPGVAELEVNQRRREEHEARLGLAVHFSVARWLDLSIGYSFEAIFSDFSISRTDATGTTTDKSSYLRHQVFGGVVGRY